MSYLLDTNVISEVRKGPKTDPVVATWYASVTDGDLYLSVLVIGELRKGIELLRARDLVRARALGRWLEQVEEAFGERVLPIDRAVATEWGAMSAVRPIPVIDGLLAATAKVHGMTLVTRNAGDVEGLGARILNPFQVAPAPPPPTRWDRGLHPDHERR